MSMTKTTIAAQLMASANTIGNTTAVGTIAGSGIALVTLKFLSDYATGITALCLIIGLVTTIVFKIMGYIELKRHHKEIETNDTKNKTN